MSTPSLEYISHMRHPTLALTETPKIIIPFPLAENQVAIEISCKSNRPRRMPEKVRVEHVHKDSMVASRAGAVKRASPSLNDVLPQTQARWKNGDSLLSVIETLVRGLMPCNYRSIWST